MCPSLPFFPLASQPASASSFTDPSHMLSKGISLWGGRVLQGCQRPTDLFLILDLIRSLNAAFSTLCFASWISICLGLFLTLNWYIILVEN